MTDRLIPFAPGIHTPRDIGHGGPSTEYLATDFAPDGTVFNYPTIWFDKDGNPVELDRRKALAQALMHEKKEGLKFPKFAGVDDKTSISNAVNAAKERSGRGGALAEALMGSTPYWSP